jgi:hypothetical protein
MVKYNTQIMELMHQMDLGLKEKIKDLKIQQCATKCGKYAFSNNITFPKIHHGN